METESISDNFKKTYEFKLTDKIEKAADALREADISPTLDNMREARAWCRDIMISIPVGRGKYRSWKTQAEFIDKEIGKTLHDIEILLWGNINRPEYIETLKSYNITRFRYLDDYGKECLDNARPVLEDMITVKQLLVQFAVDIGLLLWKQRSRIQGAEALDDAASQ